MSTRRNESDAKQLAEVLDTLSDKLPKVLSTLSDKIPALLRGILDVLYSREAAENMAESVGSFYKKLVETGIPSEDALDMTRAYMLSLRDMMGSKGVCLDDVRKSANDSD